MKHFTTVLGCCSAMALSAAVLSADQSGTMDKDKMGKGKKGQVMVTGCVAEGSGGHYTLTNATMSGEMKDHMDKDMKPMSYNLSGGDLKAHVGHKVEVSGTMASDKMMKDAKMDKDKMSNDKTGTSGEMPGGHINVKSVKMISATCP